MAKLAILFLTAVAFQAAFAGVPRYVGGSEMMMTWNRDLDHVNSRDFVTQIDMFFKNFCQYLEYKDVDREMILCCIQKFVKFLDFLCEKLECTTCTDQVFIDCITICKNIKMECENILKCEDVHEMKMLFVNCVRMYCMEFNKWCMHEEFLVRYINGKICRHLYVMFDKCMSKDFTIFMSEHMMDKHMMKEHMMGEHMMGKHMMGKHMMGEHMMGEHMMGEHMMGEHMMGKHMMNKHMMGEHMMGEHMMGKHMMDKHMMGEHMMGEHIMEKQMMDKHMMDKYMMSNNMMGEYMMGKHMMTGYFKTNKDLFMHFERLCKKFITFCETTDMSRDMVMVLVRKFMMVIDYTLEKLCVSGKCENMMMREICMELKNIKTMLERCLSYGMLTDMHMMKMECCECVKMFFRCMEKWMMCNNCCVDFDMICKDICMRFMTFCETVCGSMCMTNGNFLMNTDLKMDVRMWFKKLMVFFERTDMTKDMMMVWIPKFMTVVDYTIEKLCFEGKCHNMMIHEICTELKNIKMVLERCLTYDFHQMKMEYFECCDMFYKCLEKFMMCNDCCVSFDIICKDICMYFIDFCRVVCGRMDWHMMTGMYHKGMTFNKDLSMHFRMLVKKLVDLCESGTMTKEMMMMCMRKFMMIIDFTLEKLCFGDKCNNSMMGEICVELRKCKMMLERCLSYGMFTDVYRMKMECCECFKMFFTCMERWMMCDNCCVGFEMIWRDVFMRFESLCSFVFQKMNIYGMDHWRMTGDYSTMYSGMKPMMMMPYFMHRYMQY